MSIYSQVNKPLLRPPVERGQYTSLAFGRTLRESELVASMGSRGDAYDNAACESVISTLKVEWIKRHRYESRDSGAPLDLPLHRDVLQPEKAPLFTRRHQPRRVRETFSKQPTKERQ
jgi:transposase InsO family protein